MPLPTDPLLATQWHLINTTPGELDLNVAGVWNPTSGPAYTGAGITVVVIDDGFDYTHADLAPNYSTALDYDFDGNDLDPFGLPGDAHGTAVAGIIGADNNGSGAVGVAFDSTLIGYRTEGLISDTWLATIAESIGFAATNAAGDVINISQGIANDAFSEFANGYTLSLFTDIRTAIGTAVDNGRGGLGSIIVKSAGNSRGDFYDVNADLWTNDTRQIVVAAVDATGDVSSYSSYGAAILVSAFGGPGTIVTTDRVGADGYDADDFTEGFNGTSSAAPMVSGVVALMLEANSGLGWRDVQSILANTARQVGSEVGAAATGSEFFNWGFNAASTWNGGGLHFSNDYGYGLVDALAAVRLAESWLQGGYTAATNDNEFSNTMDMLNVSTVIPDANATGTTFTGNASFDDIVERVTVTVTLSTTYMADMELYVTSPDGTVSILSQSQAGGLDFNGTWTFETQAFRGERGAGTWSVRVVDNGGGDVLSVSDIVVRTYGASTLNDRYVYTNEYSDYAGLFSHVTVVTDANGGSGDIVNAAAVTSASTIRLDGTNSTIDGIVTQFIGMEHAAGGDGNDTLGGSTGDNMLYGNRGNDLLTGGNGHDSVYGGVGNDVLSGGSGNDVIDGGSGNDRVTFSGATSFTVNLGHAGAQVTGQGTDTLLDIEFVTTDSGNDSLTGNGLGNSFTAQDGNDTLDGAGGNDSLYGGNGNDQMIGGTGNDILDGGGGLADRAIFTGSLGVIVNLGLTAGQNTGYGIDRLLNIENLISGSGNDVLTGSSGDNTLAALQGNDAVYGGAGNDLLYGGDGNDVVNGGTGNDRLYGGLGIDTVLGGTGADDFYFNTIIGATEFDRITDFVVADDTMRLENAIFTGLAAGTLTAAAFRANLTGLAADADDRILYETDTGRLYFDFDGTGGTSRVQFAVVTANLLLTNTDFVVF